METVAGTWELELAMTALLIRRDENSVESPLYDNITSMKANEGRNDYVI